MTISVNKYTNGKLNLGASRVTIGNTAYNFPNVILLLKYIKNNVVTNTLRDALSVRTNSLTFNNAVGGQAYGASAIYSNTGTLTDLHFPASPAAATLVTNLTTLGSTAVNVTGGGTGKTRIVGILNTDTTTSRSFTLTADGDNISITIPASKGVAFLLVNTPTNDQISLADPANSGKIQYFVVETSTTNANTDPYTRNLTELDAFGNTVDTGNDSGTFYWFSVGVQTLGSSVVVGGGGFTG